MFIAAVLVSAFNLRQLLGVISLVDPPNAQLQYFTGVTRDYGRGASSPCQIAATLQHAEPRQAVSADEVFLRSCSFLEERFSAGRLIAAQKIDNQCYVWVNRPEMVNSIEIPTSIAIPLTTAAVYRKSL